MGGFEAKSLTSKISWEEEHFSGDRKVISYCPPGSRGYRETMQVVFCRNKENESSPMTPVYGGFTKEKDHQTSKLQGGTGKGLIFSCDGASLDKETIKLPVPPPAQPPPGPAPPAPARPRGTRPAGRT